MGAWGPGSFENDHALDWLSDLEDARGGDGPVIAAMGDLENWEAVLAAAEVMAARNGSPLLHLPDEVREWLSVARRSAYTREELLEAAEAVQLIRSNGGVAALWPDPSGWYEAVDDLLRRLKALASE